MDKEIEKNIGEEKPQKAFQKKDNLSPLELTLARRMKHLPLDRILRALELYKEKSNILSIITFNGEEIAPLDLEELQQCISIKEKSDRIKKRQKEIIQDLDAKGKLDEVTKNKLEKTFNPALLEDIYLPYKLKGRTAAIAAKEEGLGPLADWIWNIGHGKKEEDEQKSLEEKAKEFLKEDSLKTVEDVLSKTQNIIIEKIAEETELRAFVRSSILQKSKLKSIRSLKAKDKSKFKRFFDYQEPTSSLRKVNGAVRYLMMRKAEATHEVALSFEQNNKREIIHKFEEYAVRKGAPPPITTFLQKAASTALNSNVNTGIYYDTHKLLKENAEDQMLRLFSKEIRKRLLQAPFGSKSVIGIDPGQDKKNCSIALLNEKGLLLPHKTLSIKEEKAWDEFYKELLATVKKVSVEAIAILNTSHTNTIRKKLQELFEKEAIKLPVIPIYDQSCTIYSTSALAKKELTDLSASARRAVFIGRFLQDPMQQLVKVDPRFIVPWIGSLDIDPRKLLSTMSLCVSSCVAKMGLDINTASISLLSRVFNVNLEEAQKIITRREEKPFKDTEELKDVLNIAAQVWEKINFFLQTSPVEKDIRSKYELQVTELLHKDTELKRDTKIRGIVSSVTSFGVFVDIGLESDALIHITDFKDKELPYGNIVVGQAVDVWLLANDSKKQQATLSLKNPEERTIEKKRFLKRRAKREPRKGKGKTPETGFKRSAKTKEKKPPKKKQEQRDPKTGALLKQTDSIYTSIPKNKKGKKLPTKAKVITYNPFAGLDKIIKKPEK